MARADLSVKWKNLTANNVKDATAELRELAMDMLGFNNAPQKALNFQFA